MAQKDINSLIEKIHEWRKCFPIGKELHRFLNEKIKSFNDLERATVFPDFDTFFKSFYKHQLINYLENLIQRNG